MVGSHIRPAFFETPVAGTGLLGFHTNLSFSMATTSPALPFQDRVLKLVKVSRARSAMDYPKVTL